MNIQTAYGIIRMQEKGIKAVNGVRFIHNGYEYRLTYMGGFAAYVGIDRRQVGKRNFKYFGGVGAYHCWKPEQVMELVEEELKKKGVK